MTSSIPTTPTTLNLTNRNNIPPSTPGGIEDLDSNNNNNNNKNNDNDNDNIWSSILDSVANTRGVVTKNLIILGKSRTGKSTIISRLATTNGEVSNGDDDLSTGNEVLDLGLSYSSLDVGDDSEEDALARIGIYQLPSALPPYPSLLPLALSKSTLLDSMIMIVLDWEKPWTFLKDLCAWLNVLEGVLKVAGSGWEGGEGKERVEAQLRHYFEPPLSTSNTTSSGPSVAQLVDIETPLPLGILTDNLGISLVIVCTKADQINSLERDKDFKEEQFDYIQQTLRTIALRYGAGLFFTSQTRPTSFSKLQSYILHQLFSPSPSLNPTTSTTNTSLPLPLLPSSKSTTTTTITTTIKAFSSFPFRANVVDRDQILVPSGWDSWGKIKILRDRFDPDGMGKGWELDLEGPRSGKDEVLEAVDEEGRRIVSAVRMYDEVIMDLEGDDLPINLSHSKVEAQDEQGFLQSHYETLQRDREKDPRNAFTSRGSHFEGGSEVGGVNDEMRFPAAVVGPMSSIGLSMETVERANFSMEDSSRMSRKDSNQSNSIRSPNFNSLPLSQTNSSNGHNNPLSPTLSQTQSLTSPTLSQSGLPPTPGAGGQAQNEVLAKFFASLLAKRGTGGTTSPLLDGGNEPLPEVGNSS